MSSYYSSSNTTRSQTNIDYCKFKAGQGSCSPRKNQKEVSNSSQISDTVQEVSRLLLDKQIIQDFDDQQAFMQAIAKVAKQVVTKDSFRYKKKFTRKDFEQSTYNRMKLHQEKVENWRNTQQKIQIEEITMQMQQKPVINKKSKEFASNQAPIYERYQEIIRNKKKKQFESQKSELAQQSKQEVSEKRQNQFLLNQECWAVRKQQKIQQQQQQYQKQKNIEITLKPEINFHSNQMTQQRSLTPVFERLYEQKKQFQTESPYNHHPNINERSLLMTQKRHGKVHNRLYNLRKSFADDSFYSSRSTTPQPKTTSQSVITTPSKVSKGYKINTSYGTILSDPVSEVML